MASDKMLKDAVKEGKVVIGKSSVLRALKTDSLKAVFTSRNCPPGLLRDIQYYSGISKAEVLKFSGDSAQLGQVCGKPFKIAILGIEK
jgi:large subunit ribosomal protein L30e